MSNFTFLKTERPDLRDAASKAEALKRAQSTSPSERNALFAILLHRAFRGEL